MFSAGAGYGFFENLGCGLGFKVIRQDLGNSDAKGYGLDIGFIYKNLDDKLAFGFAAKDLFAKLKWEIADPGLGNTYSYSEPILEKYAYGVSYKFKDMLTSFDLIKIQNSKVWPHVGFEYTLRGQFALRCGIDKYKPALGFGITRKALKNLDITFDYAFRYDTDELASLHFFSINLGFGI